MFGLSEKPFSHAEYLKRLADQASKEGRREQCVELIAALYTCFGDDVFATEADRGASGGNRLVDEAETVSG